MRPTVLCLVDRVALETGLHRDTIVSDRRDRTAAWARFAVMKVARDLGYSRQQVARRLMRDGSTVLHGARRAEEIAATNTDFRMLLEKIR